MARSISALTAWRQHTFAALSDRHFRVLFAGTMFATFGYMMMMMVMAIVAYDLSGNNTAVGLIGSGVGLAMLLAPFGGVIADRVNRKRLIVFGQGGGAAMLILTGVLLAFDLMSLPLMFVLMMALGFSFVLMGPARNAFTADLVGPRLIGNAVVLNQLAHTWGQPFSPAIASLALDSFFGSGGTYMLMGALVSVGVLTMAIMPNRGKVAARPQTSDGPVRSVLRDIADGGRYVWRRPPLRLMLAVFVSAVVIGFLFRTLVPALLEEHLGRESTDMGPLLLVYGLASAAVSIFVAGATTTRWAWPVVLGMMALLGVGYLALSQVQSYGQAMIAMALLGPGMQGPVMILQARMMMHTESAYYGRVMSFTMMSWGVQMLCGLPAGILADALGEREVLAGGGLLAFVVTGLAAFGWLAIRKDDRPTPSSIPARPVVSQVGARVGANGGGMAGAAAPAMPPPMLRPVALMSGQKIDHQHP